MMFADRDRETRAVTLRRFAQVLALVAAWGPARAEPPRLNGDFESGVAGWRLYGGAGSATVMTQTTEEHHSGAGALKVATGGANRLEGVTVAFDVVPDREYRADVWLKGSGTVMLCVLRGGIWVYSRPVDMTTEWRLSSLRFVALGAATSFSVLTTKTGPQKVSFFVDDVAVVEEPAGHARAAEVAPFGVEAEDFRTPGAFGQVVADASASGGACVEGRRYYWLAYDVPYVPQTTLPFYIHLRVRGVPEAQNSLVVMRVLPGAKGETLFRMAGPTLSTWQWLCTGPHSYRIGERFCVSAGSNDAKATIALDAMVVSTRKDLSEGELQEALSHGL